MFKCSYSINIENTNYMFSVSLIYKEIILFLIKNTADMTKTSIRIGYNNTEYENLHIMNLQLTL